MAEHLKHGNFLPADGFRLSVDKFPSIGPLAQGVYIPGMIMGEANIATPFVDYSLVGDKIVFEKLNITLAMDENMEVFREINQWIRGMGFPASFEQFGKTQLAHRTKKVLDDLYSDISLIILNSKSNPNMQIRYFDAFPISTGGFQMDTTNSDTPHITIDVAFTFRDFEISRIGGD